MTTKATAPTCPTCHRPTVVKERASSRDVRHAYYKALTASGATLCPACRDYINPATHDCARYQNLALWKANAKASMCQWVEARKLRELAAAAAAKADERNAQAMREA